MYKASVVGQIELNTANAKSPASSSSSSSNLSAAACLEPEDAELGVLFSTPRLLRPVFDSVNMNKPFFYDFIIESNVQSSFDV